MRFLIQSCTDGVWETRDACDTQPQYESGLDSLEVYDHGSDVTAYRVLDTDGGLHTVILEREVEPVTAAVKMLSGPVLPPPFITLEHTKAFNAAFPVTAALLPKRKKGAA